MDIDNDCATKGEVGMVGEIQDNDDDEYQTEFLALNKPNNSEDSPPIMSAIPALTPSVSWAQRPKLVFVTINVSDVVDPIIKVNHGFFINNINMTVVFPG